MSPFPYPKPEVLDNPELQYVHWYFLDSSKGAEEHPLIRSKSIAGAHLLPWLDQPQAVSEELRRSLQLPAERSEQVIFFETGVTGRHLSLRRRVFKEEGVDISVLLTMGVNFRVFCLICWLIIQTGLGQDGEPIPTFGSDGIVKIDFGSQDEGRAVIVQRDGKIVVGGDSGFVTLPVFSMARYLPDGSLDVGFGDEGVVTAAFPVPLAQADGAFLEALLYQPDDKVLAIGWVRGLRSFGLALLIDNYPALIRFLPDGSPDPEFGEEGWLVVTAAGPNSRARSAALQADGRIVIGGSESLIRLQSDGEVDLSFGTDGIVRINPGEGGQSAIEAILLDSTERIVVAGRTRQDLGNDWNFLVGRYLPDGTPDDSFGEEGMVVTDVSTGFDDQATGVTVNPAGDLVVVGTSGSTQIAVVRYLEDGTRVAPSGSGGAVIVDPGAAVRTGSPGVAVREDGRTLLGATLQMDGTAVWLGQLLADGTFDPAFGEGGKVTVRSGFESRDSLGDFRILPDETLLVIGGADGGARIDDFALARFLPNGTPDEGFGNQGRVFTNITGGRLETGSGLALQSDGKIVVVGTLFDAVSGEKDAALARLWPDGRLDRSFARGGLIGIDFHGGDVGRDAVIQSDGGIVLISDEVDEDFALVRLDSGGRIDPSFGDRGRVRTDLASGSVDNPAGALLMSEDRILVVGTSDGRFAMVRYLRDGALDPSFGISGLVRTSFGAGAFGLAAAVAADGKGRIVVAGTGGVGSPDFAIARYQADGELDLAFGNQGVMLTDLQSASPDFARSLALRSDGRALVAGGMMTGEGRGNFAVVQYLEDGSLDTEFGDEGRVIFGISEDSANVIADLLIQTDDKVLLLGLFTPASGVSQAVLIRLTPEGQPDDTFGNAGIQVTELSFGPSWGDLALELHPDGSILAAGQAAGSGLFDLGVVRHENDLSHLQTIPFSSAGAAEFVGVALSNPDEQPAEFQYRAYSSAGSPRETAPDKSGNLLPGGQLAETLGEILGSSEDLQEAGWLEILTRSGRIASLFQVGTLDLEALDGGLGMAGQCREFYLPRAYHGVAAYRGRSATTRVGIANPNHEPIRIRLELRQLDSDQVLAAERSIPGKGSLLESLSDLFGEELQVAGGHVRVIVFSGRGAVGFELILIGGDTLIGLKGVQPDGPGPWYSAQLAWTGPGTPNGLSSSLNLINTSDEDRQIELAAIAGDGSPGGIHVIDLVAGEQVSAEASTWFSAPEFTGSLRVATDGPGVLGDVIFGDPEALHFAAALPLQQVAVERMVFGQAANLPRELFTGVALYSPGSPARILIQVRSEEGELLGQGETMLGAGARTSLLLTELIPGIEAEVLLGGTIIVESDQPLIGQVLFGRLRNGLVETLSAVPAAVP